MKLKLPAEKKGAAKKRAYATPNSNTKLYANNYRQVRQLIKSKGSTESEILREIVADWFRIKEIESLGRNQVEDPIRRIYERVVEEKVAPLVTAVQEIKKLLLRPSPQQTDSAIQPQGSQALELQNDLAKVLNVLRASVEQTGSDLSEAITIQVERLDELLNIQKVVQGLVSENFASCWTISDLLIRYLVEVNLRDNNIGLDEVESGAAEERRGLRLEGLKKIAEIEQFFKLPEQLRLAQFYLAARSFPLNAERAALPI